MEKKSDKVSEQPELETTARAEQEFVREVVRTELQREPSEKELDDWLRWHTEAY